MSARNTTPSLIGTATLCRTPIPYRAGAASKAGVSGEELVRRGVRFVVERATGRGKRSFIPRRYDVAVGVAEGGYGATPLGSGFVVDDIPCQRQLVRALIGHHLSGTKLFWHEALAVERAGEGEFVDLEWHVVDGERKWPLDEVRLRITTLEAPR
jgi:hypothetical protein